MDSETIKAYNQSAEKLAFLHKSLIPTEIYGLIEQYFIPNSKTADVGCGIGRDSGWLSRQGHKVVGIDASKQMLNIAKQQYPTIAYLQDSLPLLTSVKDASFHNILCSAVIMHLEPKQISQSVTNLLRIMVEGGIIVLSYRGTKQTDNREDGKLYTPIEPADLIQRFKTAGGSNLFSQNNTEEKRSHEWHTLVFKKQHQPAV